MGVPPHHPAGDAPPAGLAAHAADPIQQPPGCRIGRLPASISATLTPPPPPRKKPRGWDSVALRWWESLGITPVERRSGRAIIRPQRSAGRIRPHRRRRWRPRRGEDRRPESVAGTPLIPFDSPRAVEGGGYLPAFQRLRLPRLRHARSPISVPGVSLLGTALILRAGHLVLPGGRLPGRVS